MGCIAHLKQNYWPYGRTSQTCQKKEWKDGFCKIHHPEEKRKRQRERDNKKEILFKLRNK